MKIAAVHSDEARVVEAFCRFLEVNGWRVDTEVDFVDVVAERDGVTLYAEAKGRTAATGSTSTRCTASF